MGYLSDTEKAEVVRAEHEFDRKLVHALYREKMEEAAGMAGKATWCPGCAKMTGGEVHDGRKNGETEADGTPGEGRLGAEDAGRPEGRGAAGPEALLGGAR